MPDGNDDSSDDSKADEEPIIGNESTEKDDDRIQGNSREENDLWSEAKIHQSRGKCCFRHEKITLAEKKGSWNKPRKNEPRK